MGFKDFYFGLEDKYYKMIDSLDTIFPAHAIVDKIDKIMPSMIFFFILFLIIIGLVVWALIPSYTNVTISFFNGPIKIADNLQFSLFVGDNNYSFEAKDGTFSGAVPKSDSYRIKVDTAKYGIDDTFSFADEIKVILTAKKKIIPVEVFFKSGYDNVNSASAYFECENVTLPDSEKSKTTTNAYVEVEVPDDCGTLNIVASAEGYSQAQKSCDSTSCIVTFSSLTQANLGGTSEIPTAFISLTIVDSVDASKDGTVTVYNVKDLITPVEIDYSVSGSYKSKALPVGIYKVYVTVTGYLTTNQTITLTEPGVSSKIIVEKNTLGNFVLKLDEDINFSVVLKTLTNEILFSGDSQNNAAILPIYAYGKYLVDINPKDGNYGVIANKEINIVAGQQEIVVDVKEITSFNSKKFNIRLLDEDEKPIEGANVFVQDLFTGFEIFSYVIPETDTNGYTHVTISQDGAYLFRAYKGYSEGMSDQVQVTETSNTEIPQEEVKVFLYLGNGSFDISVLDDLGYPIPFAEFSFFNKSTNIEKLGSKLSDNKGKMTFSLKAGTKKFFEVKSEGYLPFFSESRVLTPQIIWDGNVNLEPQKFKDDEEKARVTFLGIFDSMGGEKTSFEIGKEVYLGYDIHLYQDVSEMEFQYITGTNSTDVEQDPLFIIGDYASSQIDSMYEDFEKNNPTEDEGKVLTAKWNKGVEGSDVEKGTYRIYIKIKVRNDSSVSLYSSLNVSWELFLDNSSVSESHEEKQYFLGSSLDCTDMFCAKTSVLDLESQLYLENLGNVNKNEQKYSLVIGKGYKTEFTLMNGITATDGEIKNGYLKAHTANAPGQSFLVVENDLDNYNYFNFTNITLSGPNTQSQNWSSAKSMLVDKYEFTNFFANKTINGNFDFIPTTDKANYLNFWIIDTDKQVPVRGEPAFNYSFIPDAAHSLAIKFFPNTVLVPTKAQDLKVYVYDETGSIIKDAVVSIFKKGQSDDGYYAVQSDSCVNMVTDYEGKILCKLPPLEKGTFIQILAYKPGYKSYKHKDLTPDLKVLAEIVTFNPEKLEIDLAYPKEKVKTADLEITNASAQDLILENAEIIFDKYSQDSKYLLNWEAMESYFNSEFNGKVIYGMEEGMEPNETNLQYFFKVIAKESSTNTIPVDKISGKIKLHLSTSPGDIVLEIPFTITFRLDSYPENASECLSISMVDNQTDFYLEKEISAQVEIVNSCLLDVANVKLATLDKAFVQLSLEDGSYGVAGYTISIPDKMSATLDIGFPTLVFENWKADFNPIIAGLGITPRTTKGTQKIGIKLIGYVNTESGPAKIESNKIEINVSAMNLADCIGVYDTEGEKIEKLDFEVFDSTAYLSSFENIGQKINGPSKEIEIKNECVGSTLFVRVCKDNEYPPNFSAGCGNENTEARLRFSDDKLTDGVKIVGGESKEIEIYRPSIPGAYALDIWLRTPDQFGFKKIYDLKTNVQTTSGYGLFSYSPFLQVNTDGNSDVMYLFNTDVRLYSLMDLEVLSKINTCEGEESGCWDSLDRLNFSSNLGTYSGDKVDNDADARAAVFIASAATTTAGAITFAAIALTLPTIAATTYMSATGALLITAAATAPIPVAGWIICGIAAAAAATMVIVAAISDFEQSTEYFIYNNGDVTIPPYRIDLDTGKLTDTLGVEKVLSEDIIKSMDLTGEAYFRLYHVNKQVAGSVGFTDGDHKKDLWFKVSCGPGYEVYEPGIIIHDTKKQICGWPEKPYEITGNSVEFKPDCSGAGFLDGFELKSNVYVLCKMDNKTWLSEQFKGIPYGLPGTGLARVIFTKPTESLLPGNNYFDISFNMENSLDTEGTKYNYRVALYNPLQEEQKSIPLGAPCTNSKGDVLGFTGENAAPKIEYNWSWKDGAGPYKKLAFCGEDNYCDSTQLLMNMFNRIDTFNKDIKTLGALSVPMLPPIPEGVDVDINYLDAVAEQIGVTNMRVQQNPDTKEVYFIVTKTQDSNISKISVSGTGIDIQDLVNLSETNPNIYLFTLITDVKKYSDLNNIEKEFILNVVNVNAAKTKTLLVKVKFKYYPPLPQTAMNIPLSTEINNGMMQISNYFLDVNGQIPKETNDKLNAAKDKIYFQADLMKDGFGEDFINDFVDACNDDFFECPDHIISTYLPLLKSGKLKILNVDGTKTLSGPGKYLVRTIITYDNMDLEIKDIYILLEKAETPVQDNILYYMPLDGPVGITNYVVDRQGYGVDFSGNTIDLFKMGDYLKKATTDSTSNPINTLDTSNDYSFVKANKIDRGSVLSIDKIADGFVSVNFVPLMQTKIDSTVKVNPTGDTKFCYSVLVDSQTYDSPDSVLPFFAKDANLLDFTGQKLADNYPKSSEPNVCGNQSGIKYNQESVTSDTKDIELYAYIYTKENAGTVSYKSPINMLSNGNPTSKQGTGKTLQDVFTDISGEKLCINSTSQWMNVFWNEYKEEAEEAE